MPSSKKLVLVMIDSLKADALEAAIEAGGAPTLGALKNIGTYDPECVSTFPTVTPVASASIVTAAGPAEHEIPGMNWYSKGEARYVEYGSSWQATRAFGVVRTLTDTVYNMNLEHLSKDVTTVFEDVEDGGSRAACTTFLIYRGRRRHPVTLDGMPRHLADAATFTHATWGPSELFYGELFQSRPSPCRPTFAMPGTRDEFTGCVGRYLLEEDLYDFMLFSLPDNDYYCHRFGPAYAPQSIARADRQIDELVIAAGGMDAFLDTHAVLVLGDHGQERIVKSIDLAEVLSDWSIALPNDRPHAARELAVSPSGRFATVYLLGADGRKTGRMRQVKERLLSVEGIDLVSWRVDKEARVANRDGELVFAPGGDNVDRRSEHWSLEGDQGVLSLTGRDGLVDSSEYPDALGRLWSSLSCRRSGDLIISAAPGVEFADWGGSDHIGGGGHGSLHRVDSLVPWIAVDCDPATPADTSQLSIRDAASVVRRHFGVQ